MYLLLYFFTLLKLSYCISEPPVYYRIVDDIFVGYSTNIRPVRNSSEPTHVRFELKPRQIIMLNARYQFLRLMCWITEYWKDELLYWDPGKFDNVTRIFIPPEKIWKPDTYPYENLEMNDANSYRMQPALLQTLPGEKKALVKLSYPAMLQLKCKMHVQEFPHDVQKCRITVASWTGYATELIYHPTSLTSEYLQKNLEWTLDNMTQWEDVVGYNLYVYPNPERVPVGWSEIYFELVFHRMSNFYISSLIIPTGILIQVCFFGLFTLSGSDGTRSEKVSIGITTILALSVLLLVVADLLPRGSSPLPKINMFIIHEIVIMSVALMFGCIIIYFQYYTTQTDKPVPKWLLLITCVKKEEDEENNDEEQDGEVDIKNGTYSTASTDLTGPAFLHQLQKIRQHISFLLKSMTDKEKSESNSALWAKVLVRLELIFLVLFSLASLIDTLHFIFVIEDYHAYIDKP